MKPDIAALKKQFREGRHAEAIAGCEASCRREPANLELQRLCATMHALVHNYARALELLQQVLQQDPGNADVLFNIGMCEKESGNFERAAQVFTAYTEQFPNHPDGWASLAECKFEWRSLRSPCNPGRTCRARPTSWCTRSFPASCWESMCCRPSRTPRPAC